MQINFNVCNRWAQEPDWVMASVRFRWPMLCCMANNTATPKARALGAALRELRVDAGIKLREFAGQIGKDPGTLSRIETGKRAIDVADVAQILGKLGVTGARYDELVDMARGGTEDPLWLAVSLPEQRQHLAALLEFERSATTITEVSPLLIPGLLQTNEYVREIMSAANVPASEFETRIAVRLGRRDVITRHRDPVRFVALVGEAALRQMVGGRAVMVDQLRYLLEMAARPNVDLRVVPFGTGWHPGLETPFTLIDSDDAQPVAQVEMRVSGLFLGDEEYLRSYRQAADTVLEVAMSPEESAGLIAAEVDRMESTG